MKERRHREREIWRKERRERRVKREEEEEREESRERREMREKKMRDERGEKRDGVDSAGGILFSARWLATTHGREIRDVRLLEGKEARERG